MDNLLQKLEAIHYRFIEVGKMITDPDIISDMDRYVKLSREYKELEEMSKIYFDYNGYTYWHMENIINRCVEGDAYHEREKNGRLPENFKE